ncbi:MAG: Mini-ribonuclease 3 [Bacillota bacterium]|nr:Mini-ribonuclease 3 [Bacillota bacterium]
MLIEFFENLLKDNNISNTDIKEYSPLVLAYIGDSVYEIFIRTLLVSKGNAPVYKLHKQSVAFVKAKAQSDILHSIMNNLTEEEQEIARRGRNAKSGTIPKNADVAEYKYATGFESLLGYLYLEKNYDRLIEILRMSIN